ncbi:hypothetical protein GGX14DRAFT_620040 [Mycena pura]|uniref:Uncharacterized protein n=1 Tax=Mycena pura TaxID=153505 RepID=A0AAD6VII9_9AGAR|nr:hypothetical protein GGX14DRAFT_620040 [Mycena pura]
MSSISESLAVAASAPTNTPVQAMLALLVLAVAAGTMYYASPSRLTRIMVAAIANAEKVYIDALESGALSATDVHIDDIVEKMSRETYLYPTLHAACTPKYQIFAKRPFATHSRTAPRSVNILPAMHSRSFGASGRSMTFKLGLKYNLLFRTVPLPDYLILKILKEAQLRDIYTSSTATRGVSLRRRRNPS